ncbi:hypothetical protein GUJ93_ZPchr0010g8528 [Zizania palustris]|uniref:Uncharacterized protein n=1 Tax=Zizania palustris TaxID=103762 RepID=A0A8J6BLX1_ZIZPA|nr:hypothetical protein GUJ93_ZPchr0010g8528 [Zizania palustris]
MAELNTSDGDEPTSNGARRPPRNGGDEVLQRGRANEEDHPRAEATKKTTPVTAGGEDEPPGWQTAEEPAANSRSRTDGRRGR